MNTRIFRTEVRDKLLGIVKEATALFFSVLMPVAFFALFAAMFGGDGASALSRWPRTGHLVCCPWS